MHGPRRNLNCAGIRRRPFFLALHRRRIFFSFFPGISGNSSHLLFLLKQQKKSFRSSTFINGKYFPRFTDNKDMGVYGVVVKNLKIKKVLNLARIKVSKPGLKSLVLTMIWILWLKAFISRVPNV